MNAIADAHAYTVQVFRDHGFLILEVPELDAIGQARSLATAKDTARELVAMWLDVPADQVRVVMDYTRIDPEALRMVAGAHQRTVGVRSISRNVPFGRPAAQRSDRKGYG
ncbi:MAG: hypothetical protein ACRDSP_17880 [Pseudonocardiaceae bacterium]